MKPKPRYWRGASPELHDWARENRNTPTSAEEALWEVLRSRRLNGLRFRRQHAYETYIFDFYCAEYRLIIEVDGGYHDNAFQAEKDTERDTYLVTCGFRIIRLINEEVLRRRLAIKNKILNTLTS